MSLSMIRDSYKPTSKLLELLSPEQLPGSTVRDLSGEKVVLNWTWVNSALQSSYGAHGIIVRA